MSNTNIPSASHEILADQQDMTGADAQDEYDDDETIGEDEALEPDPDVIVDDDDDLLDDDVLDDDDDDDDLLDEDDDVLDDVLVVDDEDDDDL